MVGYSTPPSGGNPENHRARGRQASIYGPMSGPKNGSVVNLSLSLPLANLTRAIDGPVRARTL
jgi:hypothetical protein